MSALAAARAHLSQHGRDIGPIDVRISLHRALALDEELGSSRVMKWLDRHRVDVEALWARNVAALLVPVADVGRDRFEIAEASDPDARLALVLEVRDEADEDPVDLVALDAEDPHRWRTLLARAPLLDAWSARQPAATRSGAPLHLWRGPLGWLRAGCTGAVLLQPAMAFSALGTIGGPFVAEDREHARVLAAATAGWLERSRILVRRAAA